MRFTLDHTLLKSHFANCTEYATENLHIKERAVNVFTGTGPSVRAHGAEQDPGPAALELARKQPSGTAQSLKTAAPTEGRER